MANGDYVELIRRIRKTKTHYIYQTRGVAAAKDSTGVPKVKAAMASPDFTVTDVQAMCAEVQMDEEGEPGRIVFDAVWRQPISRSHTYL
jgi:hypothetical protein